MCGFERCFRALQLAADLEIPAAGPGNARSVGVCNQRSPELISYEEVADWLYYLVEARELSPSTVN
jgi:hypothetical protein